MNIRLNMTLPHQMTSDSDDIYNCRAFVSCWHRLDAAYQRSHEKTRNFISWKKWEKKKTTKQTQKGERKNFSFSSQQTWNWIKKDEKAKNSLTKEYKNWCDVSEWQRFFCHCLWLFHGRAAAGDDSSVSLLIITHWWYPWHCDFCVHSLNQTDSIFLRLFFHQHGQRQQQSTKAIYPYTLFSLFLSEEISKVLISAHWTTIKRMFSSFLLCFLWVHLYCCWMLGQSVGWWWWCENKTKAFELVFWAPMHVSLFLSRDWEMETFHFESTEIYRIVGSMECCLRQNRRHRSLLGVLRFLRSVENVECWKLLLLSGM